MTAERKHKLLHEAAIHFDWLRHAGNTLDDIEVTCRELLRLHGVEASREIEAARAAYNAPVKRYTRTGVLIEPDDACGVFVE